MSLYPSRLVEHSIRFVRLLPATDTSQDISCTLTTIRLPSSQNYQALSYACGDQSLRRDVVCNGRTLSVTQNLHEALWQLREDGCFDLLWIDAISINQRDSKEKTNQVRMMHDIFQNAEEVIIWLGRFYESDTSGLSLLEDLCESVGTLGEEEIAHKQFSPVEQLLDRLPRHDEWRSLSGILGRPWFRRIWVIQEYVCACRCSMKLGDKCIDPEKLFQMIQKILEVDDSHMQLAVSRIGASTGRFFVNNPQVFGHIKAALIKGKGFSLMELYDMTRDFLATDSRDKVFALLELACDVPVTFVDYDLPYEDVLTQLWEATADSSHKPGTSYIDALSRVSAREGGSTNSQRLSWLAPLGDHPSLGLWTIYPTKMQNSEQVQKYSIDADKRLGLKGLIFDYVEGIAADLPPNATKYVGSTSVEYYRGNAPLLIEWDTNNSLLVHSLRTYPTGEDLFDVYWRTLLANRAHGGSIPSEEYGLSFGYWRRLMHLSFPHVNKIRGSRDLVLRLASWVLQPWISLCCGAMYIYHELFWFPFYRTWSGLCLATVIYFCFAVGRWTFALNHDADVLETTIKRERRVILRNANPFKGCMSLFTIGRKLGRTNGGYLGLVPQVAIPGDRICFFQDCRIPFVIRPAIGGWRLLGDAYIHGMMDTERGAFDESKYDLMWLV